MKIDRPLLEKQIKTLAKQLNKKLSNIEREHIEGLLNLLGDIADAKDLETLKMDELLSGEVAAAMNYLCDGDIAIAQMVEAIRNHPDGDDYIDNVDGVVVWSKVENTFTCNEFIDLINQ